MRFPVKLLVVSGLLVLTILAAFVAYAALKWVRQHKSEPQRVEIVSVNEENRTLIARDVKTGKTFSVGFGDAVTGIVVLTDGAAARAVPAWVPRYPGSSPENGYAASASDSVTGAYHFKATNKAAAIVAFFDRQLRNGGMVTQVSNDSITGDGAGGHRHLTLSVSEGGSESNATVTYVEKP